ncbi:MAG: aldo/keto reductase [Xanthomonadales bacterium]|nr:aldo/keto reductase [Xanthomonadales bacterium]
MCPRQQLESGYSCARIINGCWQLSVGHGGNRLDRTALMRRFSELADAGFTTFDCADIYTGVEALLGEFLAGCANADSLQIHTKYVPDLDSLAQLGPRDTERIIHRSLKRLQRERLDLVQFHWWDYGIPGYIEAFETLERLRESGKIALLGVTNFDVRHLSELLDAGFNVKTLQAQYSLLDRRPEKGMQAFCEAHGISILAYGVLAGGLLASAPAAPESSPPNRSHAKYRLLIEETGGPRIFARLRSAISSVADRHGCTPSMVASAWVLKQAAVGAVILGIGNRSHVGENLALSALDLDGQDLATIDRALAGLATPRGDVFELERQPDSRHAANMKMNLNASENGANSS